MYLCAGERATIDLTAYNIQCPASWSEFFPKPDSVSGLNARSRNKCGQYV